MLVHLYAGAAADFTGRLQGLPKRPDSARACREGYATTSVGACHIESDVGIAELMRLGSRPARTGPAFDMGNIGRYHPTGGGNTEIYVIGQPFERANPGCRVAGLPAAGIVRNSI